MYVSVQSIAPRIIASGQEKYVVVGGEIMIIFELQFCFEQEAIKVLFN